MKVILKCRFGDHLPDPRVAVELDKNDADYLITQGLAELPKDDTIVQGENVHQAEVARLTEELATSQAEVARLNDTIVQGENLPTNVKSLQAEVKSLTAQVVSLTEERDNAVTALELAKGVGDGADNTAKN